MKLYPYGPYEEVLSELDEDFTDLNQNGKWDKSETFIDNNENGIRDEFRPATFPDKYYIFVKVKTKDIKKRDFYKQLLEQL